MPESSLRLAHDLAQAPVVRQIVAGKRRVQALVAGPEPRWGREQSTSERSNKIAPPRTSSRTSGTRTSSSLARSAKPAEPTALA